MQPRIRQLPVCRQTGSNPASTARLVLTSRLRVINGSFTASVFLIPDVGISTSPNPNAILRLQIQLVARRDVVGLVPRFDIAHRIAAIFPRRMRVGFDLPANPGFALRSEEHTSELQSL